MKTILILLFLIVLIGCSNNLSDKEVDAMLDKAAKTSVPDTVIIIGSSPHYLTPKRRNYSISISELPPNTKVITGNLK